MMMLTIPCPIEAGPTDSSLPLLPPPPRSIPKVVRDTWEGPSVLAGSARLLEVLGEERSYATMSFAAAMRQRGDRPVIVLMEPQPKLFFVEIMEQYFQVSFGWRSLVGWSKAQRRGKKKEERKTVLDSRSPCSLFCWRAVVLSGNARPDRTPHTLKQ